MDCEKEKKEANMRYSNVEKWANRRDAVVYDFVEDTQTNFMFMDDRSNDYRELDSYEKFCVYKYMCGYKLAWSRIAELPDALDNAKNFEKKAKGYQIGDPDSSSVLLQEIYKLLWKDVAEKPFMKQEPKKIKGTWDDGKITASDTMTSATTRFIDALNASKTKEIINSQNIAGKINKIRVAFGGTEQRWSTKLCIIVEAVLEEGEKKEFYKMIDNHYPAMRNFLDQWHTIGNYCPIPAGFNSARSGRYAEHDYWDLTLMKICDWYKYNDKRDAILAELLHIVNDDKDKNEIMKNCRDWLKWFEKKGKEVGKDGWHYFVDTLYMQDYVYNEKDGINQGHEKYYDVKPFWNKHGWKKDKGEIIGLPEDIDEINQGVEEVCIRIAARSIRIVNACSAKIAQKERMESG